MTLATDAVVRASQAHRDGGRVAAGADVVDDDAAAVDGEVVTAAAHDPARRGAGVLLPSATPAAMSRCIVGRADQAHRHADRIGPRRHRAQLDLAVVEQPVLLGAAVQACHLGADVTPLFNERRADAQAVLGDLDVDAHAD